MAEKTYPLAKYKVFLGQDKNIEIAVWPKNVELQRREKMENGEWQTTQKINLAPQVLEAMFIRMPVWHKIMEKASEANESKSAG